MESNPAVEEVMALIQGHIDAGKSVKAQTYLAHYTQLGSQERKQIAKGFAPLKAEYITNTDLSTINKTGCSVGAMALILFCACLCKLLA